MRKEYRSQESGVRSQESGVRSQESGVRSQESGARSQEPGATHGLAHVKILESNLRSAASCCCREVRSQEKPTGARKTGVQEFPSLTEDNQRIPSISQSQSDL
jgi:hypothetical protein